MKVALIAFAALALYTAQAAPLSDAQNLFERFQMEHNKTYTEDEAPLRFAAFQENLATIQNLNEIEGEEIYGIGKFSDLSQEEFRARHLGFSPSAVINASDIEVMPEVLTEAPAGGIVDWRKQGKVTPVKDQAQCGSCWAFSATEQIESAWLMAGNSKKILGVQEIVSCDKQDLGCNGGDTTTAYGFVKKNGIVLESTYPYSSGEGKTGKCKRNKEKPAAVHIKGFTYATPPARATSLGLEAKKPNEKQLQSAMQTKGPVSVCVDAGTWQNYKKGVVTRSCKRDLDHCVQAVGFNANAAKPYWIVRNSWNTDWGYDGYIYVGMGGDYCGIADEATLVNL